MEHDRYQQDRKLFIIGLISLVASLLLFAFILFIAPHLFFNWKYNTPSFLVIWEEWLRIKFSLSTISPRTVVGLILFFSAIFFALVADYCSNRIDNKIYKDELQQTSGRINKDNDVSVASLLVLRLMLIMLLCYLGLIGLHWLISVV
jgi:hypothetical protein